MELMELLTGRRTYRRYHARLQPQGRRGTYRDFATR